MLPRPIVRIYRHLKDSISYWRLLHNFSYDHLKVTKVTEKTYLDAAKRIHAEAYLRQGYVKSGDVYGGKITHKADPYQKHSQYFVVTDATGKKVLATARQIEAHARSGHFSFPMFYHVHLYKRARSLIESHAPGACVEISGLAKQRAADSVTPLLLYRAMWHHSVWKGHKLWLMACDERLFDKLKLLFGPAIERAGKTTFYMGSYVVPAVLHVPTAVAAIGRSTKNSNIVLSFIRARLIQFFLDGLPPELMSDEERRLLKEIRT